MSGGILGGLFGGAPMGAGMGAGILGQGDYMDAMANPALARQYQPGLLGGFDNFTQDNQAALLNMGAALLDGQGWGGAARGFSDGMRADERTRLIKRAEAEQAQKQVKYQELAEKLGRPEVGDMPEIVQSLALDAYKRREPTEWERLTQGLSSDELQKARRYRLGLETKPATTDDMLDYQYAQKDPAYAAFLRSKKGGPSAPSGYQFTPQGTLEPIPGGPAAKDSQIPAEIAGRLALTDEYLKNAPTIERDIKQGSMTGLWDAGKAQMGVGRQGEVYRQIQSGVDGLRRGLTGAGMPEGEATEYANRYLPQPTDSADRLLSKHRQLTEELKRFRGYALQGRGGVPSLPGGSPSTPNAGRTSTGVPWSYSR